MLTDQYITGLPKTIDLLKEYKITASKKFGQNFLMDSAITDFIVRHAGDISNSILLEIGPGPGTLTRSILAFNPKKLHVIEYDTQFLEILHRIKAIDENRLEIHINDALKIKEESIADKLIIIANLPYNIGTQLIFKWFEKIELFDLIMVMLQKEVAQRITAKTSDSAYGKISVLTNLLCDSEIILDIPPNSFVPAPKVDSSVIRLIPKAKKDQPSKEIIRTLLKICEAAFAQRRKKIRTSLATILNDDGFAKLNIDPNKRPQDISPQEYLSIALSLTTTATSS